MQSGVKVQMSSQLTNEFAAFSVPGTRLYLASIFVQLSPAALV